MRLSLLAVALCAVLAASSAPRLEAQATSTSTSTPATATAKKKITRADELPRRAYALPKLPSELVLAPLAELLPLADQLEKDTLADLVAFDIGDESTLGGLITRRVQIAMLKGEFARVPALVDELRAVQSKPAAKLAAGTTLRIAAEARARGGDLAAQKAFAKERFAAAYGAMPYAVVQDTLKGAKGSLEVVSRDLLLGSAQANLDPAAKNAGMQLDAGALAALLGGRVTVEHVLPFRDEAVATLAAVIERNTVAKPDIWTPRLAALPANAKATEVAVAIWDSGVDTRLFVTTQNPGIAFDQEARRATSLLRPLGDAAPRWPELRTYVKGAFDNQSALDTPEARAFKQHLSQLKAAEVKSFQDDMGLAGLYVHGTHVAGIAIDGNPFARVFSVTMLWNHSTVPMQPTEERSQRVAAAYREIVAALKAAGVRVVNMSWRYGPQFFESALAYHGVGKDAEERKRTAQRLFALERDALKAAFESAPEILFIAGSGNEDNDASFVDYIPAGLTLTNLMTAGAVDKAGEETSFSTFGPTVSVHANGFEVDSVFPGGDRARLSGTSMAAPQVTNLAAKLFALNPKLTPAQVKDLILRGAEKRGRVNLINPRETLRVAGFPQAS